MKLKNFGRFLPKAISTAVFLLLCGVTALMVTGCDEGMNMMDPVITDPVTDPGGKDTGNTGEIKNPEEQNPGDQNNQPGDNENPGEQDPGESETPEPTSTLTITVAGQTRDGSVILSGTSTAIPEGATVTITLGDVVTTTATVTADGSWGTTVSALQAEILATIGTVTVTAAAMKATAGSSFEYAPLTPIAPIVPKPEPVPKEVVPALKTLVPAVAQEHLSPPESNPGDFVGQVRTLYSSIYGNNTQPLAGVSVTITAGARVDEQVTTDQGGYYLFPSVTGDELYLRVEKEHFEPKEIIVHRTRPTVSQKPTGPILDRIDPWHTPGTVVMGQRWPDAIRFIFEETALPNDVLFVRDDGYRSLLDSSIGRYSSSGHLSGIVGISAGRIRTNDILLMVFAHELGHAHQHAVVIANNTGSWAETPEGRAYAQAREQDWAEVGRSPLDQFITNTYHEAARLPEGAAETSSLYWGRGKWSEETAEISNSWGLNIKPEEADLETAAPNRYKWAEKWLNNQ